MLADDGLRETAQIRIAIHLRDIDIEVQGDFSVVVHEGRNFQIDAGIDVSELRVDQRIGAYRADARLETAAGGGNLLADFQSGFLIVYRAQRRPLQNARSGIRHDGFQHSARHV